MGIIPSFLLDYMHLVFPGMLKKLVLNNDTTRNFNINSELGKSQYKEETSSNKTNLSKGISPDTNKN